MFNLFGKGHRQRVKVTDIIWMTQTAKWNGILQAWKATQPLIVCWFDDTLQHLQNLFANEPGTDEALVLASHLHPSQLAGRTVVFAEHYPLHKKEMELFERLQLPEIIVHAALNEPLLLQFGGERIAGLMKQLGMAAEESVSHPMISKAIVNAQEKIEKKVVTESLATSAAQWIAKNTSN